MTILDRNHQIQRWDKFQIFSTEFQISDPKTIFMIFTEMTNLQKIIQIKIQLLIFGLSTYARTVKLNAFKINHNEFK